MGRLIVEQIISADGYAAEPDGGIGFFENATGINDVDREQLRVLASVRAIVLGRRTFGMFAAYWPHADPAKEPVAVPINATPKYVVSNTLDSAPWGPGSSAEVLRGNGVASVQGLRRRVDGDIMIWGSLTLADALLRAGEVDVLRLRIIPKVIGSGRSFTPPDLGHRTLVLEDAAFYERGIVVLQYGFLR
jgi:dihydrofolate reductase